MIKVKISKNNNYIYELEVKGHSGYDTLGKDIVCASVSTMVITSINNILSLENTISYEESSGKVIIRVIENTDINQKILNNLIRMLDELKNQYPKNIEIRNEV